MVLHLEQKIFDLTLIARKPSDRDFVISGLSLSGQFLVCAAFSIDFDDFLVYFAFIYYTYECAFLCIYIFIHTSVHTSYPSLGAPVTSGRRPSTNLFLQFSF